MEKRMDGQTDITVPQYVPSKDGRIKIKLLQIKRCLQSKPLNTGYKLNHLISHVNASNSVFYQNTIYRCITVILICHYILLDKKARTGMAMWTVAEILDSCSKTEGNNRIITSCISRVQILREFVHVLAHLDTNPNSKHFIISLCQKTFNHLSLSTQERTIVRTCPHLM
jgi:hypothetical protein